MIRCPTGPIREGERRNLEHVPQYMDGHQRDPSDETQLVSKLQRLTWGAREDQCEARSKQGQRSEDDTRGEQAKEKVRRPVLDIGGGARVVAGKSVASARELQQNRRNK